MIIKQKIESEIRKVQMFVKLENAYWTGYIRGLRRTYYGEKFGTETEHKLWLSYVDSPNEQHKQRGLGYQAGLEYDGSH